MVASGMFRLFSALFLAVVVTATSASALAAEGESARALEPPFPVRPGAARIVAPTEARVPFLLEGPTPAGPCPETGAAACASRAYLLRRDLVVTSIARGAHVCAAFLSASGRRTTGWLPAAAVTPVLEPAHPSPDWWRGEYRAPSGRLVVAPDGDGLRASLRRQGAPDIHLSGRAEANEVGLRDRAGAGCVLRLRLIADYLIVEERDPGCGAAIDSLFRKRPE